MVWLSPEQGVDSPSTSTMEHWEVLFIKPEHGTRSSTHAKIKVSKTLSKAKKRVDWPRWKEAYDKEIGSFKEHTM